MTDDFGISSASGKRKRVVLTLEKKLEIIKKADDGFSNESLSTEYNVGLTTVRDIIKNRDKTLAFTRNSSSPTFLKYRKVMKETGSHKEIDAVLYDFVQQQNAQGLMVHPSVLLSKAEEIERTYNLSEPFCPSPSWVIRFKKRYGFTDQQISNDSSNPCFKEELDDEHNSVEVTNSSTDNNSNAEDESSHILASEYCKPILTEVESQAQILQQEETPEERPSNDPTSKLTKKREDYISWADYFMAVASLTALRSKDPNSQVGACIVNEENKIVGVGYNGMPNGCSDDLLPWAREADDVLDTKYPYVCHAEMNAICNKNCADLKGCTIYVALFPCNECAKLIIQSRIKEVVYMSDKYHHTSNVIAAKKLFDMCGVIYRQHQPTHSKILIDLNKINNSEQSSSD